MKVTVRMTLVVVVTAIMLVPTAVAAQAPMMWDTGYSDILSTQSGRVAGSAAIISDESAAFIEACRTTHQVPAAGPVFACRDTWQGVTVCSPVVGRDPIRRYADPGFWAVTGTPIESLDFLLAHRNGAAAVSDIFECGGDQRYIAHSGCSYNDVSFRGADAAAGPSYVAWASWNTGF